MEKKEFFSYVDFYESEAVCVNGVDYEEVHLNEKVSLLLTEEEAKEAQQTIRKYHEFLERFRDDIKKQLPADVLPYSVNIFDIGPLLVERKEMIRPKRSITHLEEWNPPSI